MPNGRDKLEKRVERGPVSTIVISLLLLLVVVVPIGLFSGGWQVMSQYVFGTAMESARRYSYEENRSFINGNIEELRRLKGEYRRAPEDEKFVISQTILDQFASFDRAKLPADLVSFLEELEN